MIDGGDGSTPPDAPAGDDRRTLRRALGTRLLTALAVGDILGAGIYVLVGEVSDDVGGLVWVPFLVAFALAAVTAAAYAELTTAYPHAAGSAHYVDLAYGRPVVTFLIGYVVAVTAVTTSAAVARAVGGQYLETFVDLPQVPVAVGTLVLLALLVWVGIAASARVNAAMTAVEVSGLLLVIAAGIAALATGEADPARLLESGGTDPGAAGVVGAVALAFFAYLGFEDLVHLGEEVRDPARAFPRALLGGLAIVGVLYLGVTAAAAVLVDPTRLAASSTPLVDALDAGPVRVPARVVAVIAIVAVTNTALLALTTASRQLYGLAEKGAVTGALAGIGRRRTPTVAIIAVTAVAAVLAATGGVRELADTTVVLLLAVFATVNVTVLVLRRRRPDDRRPFRTPVVLPVLGALSCTALLVDTLIRSGPALYLRLAALLGLGVVLFAVSRRSQARRRPAPPT